MEVRVPVQKLAEGLDGGDHAGQHIIPAEQALNFSTDAAPGRRGELAQQPAVETGMHAETLGDGEDHLPVGDGRADVFGDVDGGQQRPLLVAGGASAALLAGEGHENFVPAVRAANASEALVQVAAGEKGLHAALDDRPPEAVLGLEPFVVDLLEGGKTSSG